MADAQQISEEEAQLKAEQFFSKPRQTLPNKQMAPRKAPQLVLATSRDEFYVFNDQVNSGYVVISGDKRMPDVLAYSYDGFYDADHLPCNMQAWMEGYAEQVRYLRAHPEAKVSKRNATERENIGPLLTCSFGQDRHYNDKCPIVDGEHCFTGCVATAMAQIMYYWQWPKQTTDVIPAYTTYRLGIEMPAQPITTIDWDNILANYDYYTDYTPEQVDAISTLMP